MSTAAAPAPLSLSSLPPDLLRHLLLHHVDLPALLSLSQTCQRLSAAVWDDQTLWRALAQRRFRVSPRVARSRRLLAAAPVPWRVLYHQWHAARRMPASKLSGPQHAAFARGALHLPRHPHAALAWVTVASTDDCTLVAGAITLRVVLQNVAAQPALAVTVRAMALALTGCAGIPVRARHDASRADDGSGYDATLRQVAVCRSEQTELVAVDPAAQLRLSRDDFAVCTVAVQMPRAAFEIDALERLDSVTVPIACAGDAAPLVAHFREKVIWENYERLPGGWWVRA